MKLFEKKPSREKLMNEIAGLQIDRARLTKEKDEAIADSAARLAAAKEKSYNDGLERGVAKAIGMCGKLAQMSLEQLREAKSNFDVYEVAASEFVFEDDGDDALTAAPAAEQKAPTKWAVVTAYCQLGGCDVTAEFDNEYAARLYAVLMTEFGEKPDTTTCSPCYAEYMRDCM